MFGGWCVYGAVCVCCSNEGREDISHPCCMSRGSSMAYWRPFLIKWIKLVGHGSVWEFLALTSVEYHCQFMKYSIMELYGL